MVSLFATIVKSMTQLTAASVEDRNFKSLFRPARLCRRRGRRPPGAAAARCDGLGPAGWEKLEGGIATALQRHKRLACVPRLDFPRRRCVLALGLLSLLAYQGCFGFELPYAAEARAVLSKTRCTNME